jgi:SAM-dependent methyltransferase
MPENRPSIVKRIARAFRRSRELLATPELLNNIEQQIKDSLNRIEVLAHKLDALSSDLKGEVAAELSFTVHDYAESVADLHRLVGELNERLNAIETFQSETRNLVTELNTGLHSRLNGMETFQSEARNLTEELNTSLNSRMNTLETAQSETKNLVAETRNLVGHINTSIHSRLDIFENERLQSISNQIHEMIAVQIELVNQIRGPKELIAHPAERYTPASGGNWKATFERVRREFPTLFFLWRERLDAMGDAFRQTKVGNAAWGGDVYSRVFRSFVERHANGRVLDVGCGIFGRPFYLSSYPAALLSGLDPLNPQEETDFEFVRGISEYLPWPDSSFSTVISATSLDHCLSLNGSLAEARRVLRSGGHYLLWIGSVPGSPKYEPTKLEFAPADKFHLFHFDVDWFEPMVSESFEIVDRLALHKVAYSHVMYCLVPKICRVSHN